MRKRRRSHGVGNVISERDDRGVTTRKSYDDPLYRLTRVAQVGTDGVVHQVNRTAYTGNIMVQHYNAENKLVKTDTINERGLVASSELVNDCGAGNLTVENKYDSNGNLLSVTRQGKKREFTYDNENRKLTEKYGDTTTTWTYGTNGKVLTVKQPNGNTTTYTYDSLGRIASVDDGVVKTQYEHDQASRLTRVSQEGGPGHVVYAYDDVNHTKTHQQFGLDGNPITTTYTYLSTGELAKVEDAYGNETTYEYDALGRRTKTNHPQGVFFRHDGYKGDTPPYLPVSVATQYDDANSKVEVTYNKTGKTDRVTRQHDTLGRLGSVKVDDKTVSYGYHPTGSKAWVETASGKTSYTYDLQSRICTATAGSKTVSFLRREDGLPQKVDYPNGATISYDYHATDRVKSIEHKVGASVINKQEYAYDLNGNRTRLVETVAGTAETTDYTYDAINRMATYKLKNGTAEDAPAIESRTYQYTGYNRTTETIATGTGDAGTSTQSKAYTYDALNRLTTVSGGSYSIAYDYDKNGNMLRKTDSREPTPVYSVYNARNKLVQMYKGDGATGEPQAQFDYNDDGLRTLYRYSDRGDVKYVYDESSVIDEYYENGGDLLAHYTYGDRLIALDTPVTPGSTTLKRQYYHHDALGSTVGLTDEAGAVIAGYKLDPWGNIREQTGTTQNRNIFTGHAFDNSTGLYYFKARYYDAELPRFTTQDTYLGEEGTPPSLNRYLYAYSNPTVWVDPTGHEPFSPHEREAITDKAQSVGEYNQSHTDELSALLSSCRTAENASVGKTQCSYTFKPPKPRFLTDYEKYRISEYMGPPFDSSEIRITYTYKIWPINNPMSPTEDLIMLHQECFGFHCLESDVLFSEFSCRGTFYHETFHIWQRKILEKSVNVPALKQHLKFKSGLGPDPYYYDPRVIDQDSLMDIFLTASVETQAAMFEDAVQRHKHTGGEKYNKILLFVKNPMTYNKAEINDD